MNGANHLSADPRNVDRRRVVSLREILPAARFHNTRDLQVRRCASQWHECRADDLFVALVDPDSDGHDDVNRALARGAGAILAERLLPIASPQCIVEDSRVAWGHIAHALAGNPSDNLTTVAVTGRDGKSSTAFLLESIFRAARVGVVNTASPESSDDGRWTPPRLARALAEAAIASRAAIVEASDEDSLRNQLAGAGFDAVIVTRMARPISDACQPAIRLLKQLKEGGFAIINADDCFASEMICRIGVPVLTVGIRNAADVTAKIVESSIDEQTFLLTAGDDSAVMRTRTPGAAYVYNCLQAAAAALVLGIDLATIARGIDTCPSLPGRMNVVRCGQEFAVLVDQADTPWRIGAALNMIRQHVTGRIFCVFNAPIDCSTRTAIEFGRMVERHCDAPVITRSQVSPTLDYESDHQILDGFRQPARARLIPDRMTAIEWALAEARPGDAVLVAGCGERSICSLAANRWHLTDADVCKAWLYNNESVRQTIVKPVVNRQIFNIENYRAS